MRVCKSQKGWERNHPNVIDILLFVTYYRRILISLSLTFARKKEAEKEVEAKEQENLIDHQGKAGVGVCGVVRRLESRGYVCAPDKACLLRGTRKAASNLISPESKYLHEGKRRFIMVDIYFRHFFFADRTWRNVRVAKNPAIFFENAHR